jgi:hypothetical protein
MYGLYPQAEGAPCAHWERQTQTTQALRMEKPDDATAGDIYTIAAIVVKVVARFYHQTDCFHMPWRHGCELPSHPGTVFNHYCRA